MDQHLHPVSVVDVRQSSEQSPPVVLLEDDRGRQLAITIGLCEAIALTHLTAPRPMTHDLLLTLIDRLEASILRLVIDDFSNNTYFARLFLQTPDGPLTLDCRPSDGLALCLRAHAPILASEAVMIGEASGEEELPGEDEVGS